MWTKQSKQSAIYKREYCFQLNAEWMLKLVECAWVACVDSGADATIARLSKAGEGWQYMLNPYTLATL